MKQGSTKNREKRKLFCKNKNQEEEAHPALMEFFSDPVYC